MALNEIDLIVSEEISASSVVADTYTPANGAEVWTVEFSGDAAFTQNAVVKAVWKYAHATESEEILWSTKGSKLFQFSKEITGADNVRKIAIVCDNGEAGALVMSGSLKIKVKT